MAAHAFKLFSSNIIMDTTKGIFQVNFGNSSLLNINNENSEYP
jgi:hypothetical protein